MDRYPRGYRGHSELSRAFNGRGGLVAKAKWDVKRKNDCTVAVYGGRKGLGALGVLSQTSAQEQEVAIGSTVSSQTAAGVDGRTVCTMSLTASGRFGIGGLLGATADARFIRPCMQAVAKELKSIDLELRVTSS